MDLISEFLLKYVLIGVFYFVKYGDFDIDVLFVVIFCFVFDLYFKKWYMDKILSIYDIII